MENEVGINFVNFVDWLDLLCWSDYQISFFPAAYFSGWIVGSPFFSFIGDHYGRLPNVYITVWLAFAIAIVFFKIMNPWVTMTCLFLFGLLQAAKNPLISLAVELTHDHFNTLCFVIVVFDNSLFFLIPSLMIYVSKDTTLLLEVPLVLTAITSIVLFFVPFYESINYLLEKNMFSEAKHIVSKIML